MKNTKSIVSSQSLCTILIITMIRTVRWPEKTLPTVRQAAGRRGQGAKKDFTISDGRWPISRFSAI